MNASPPSDGLRAMWLMFRTFVTALLLFVVALLLTIDPTGPSQGADWYPYVLGGVGLLGVIGVFYAKSRPLDLRDRRALAGSFRTAWILGIAFAEAPALSGFMGALILERLWPYVVGLAISLALLAAMAPTRRELDRRQRAITAAGSPLSLREALSGR